MNSAVITVLPPQAVDRLPLGLVWLASGNLDGRHATARKLLYQSPNRTLPKFTSDITYPSPHI